MANWYYYNKNGEKTGPISVSALKSLAQQGLITRETVIENHTGRKANAGDVNGLTFPETEQPEPITPPTSVMPPSADGEVYGLSSPQPVITPPNETYPFGESPFPPAGDNSFGNSPNPFDIQASFPMEQFPFPQPAPTATTTPGRFCSSCGSPVTPTVKFCSNCGSPTASTAPDHFAFPVQSVTQQESHTSAKLVLERPTSFAFSSIKYDVLIDGKKMGEVANGQSIEVSVPTGGWIKLDIILPNGKGTVTAPVSMDFVAGQKKKVILRYRKSAHIFVFFLFLVALLGLLPIGLII